MNTEASTNVERIERAFVEADRNVGRLLALHGAESPEVQAAYVELIKLDWDLERAKQALLAAR